MSMQLLDKEDLGKPVPSDLIAYFSEQYQLLAGPEKSLYQPEDVQLDRTLDMKIPENPLLEDPSSYKKYTRTFFYESLKKEKATSSCQSNPTSPFQTIGKSIASLFQSLTSHNEPLREMIRLQSGLKKLKAYEKISTQNFNQKKQQIENPNNFDFLDNAISRTQRTQKRWLDQTFPYGNERLKRTQVCDKLKDMLKDIDSKLEQTAYEPYQKDLTTIRSYLKKTTSENNKKAKKEKKLGIHQILVYQHQYLSNPQLLYTLVCLRISHELKDGRNEDAATDKDVTLQSRIAVKMSGLSQLPTDEQLHCLDGLAQIVVKNEKDPSGNRRYTYSPGCCSTFASFFKRDNQLTGTQQLHISILQNLFIEIVKKNKTKEIKDVVKDSSILDIEISNLINYEDEDQLTEARKKVIRIFAKSGLLESDEMQLLDSFEDSSDNFESLSTLELNTLYF